MKLSELSKAELCGLILQILSSSQSPKYVLNNFLSARHNKRFNCLMDEFESIDVIQDFDRFQKVNKQLDKLHNNSDYYLQLDELKG